MAAGAEVPSPGPCGDSTAVAEHDGASEPRGRPSPVAKGAEPEGEIGRIGRFRLLGELGRGGMGIVYRAWDEPLRRVVALKVLRADCRDVTDRQRLVREAQLAARFQNDHVVTIHAVVDPPDGLPYLVMEYVEGPTLAALAGASERPAAAVVARFAAEVADALEAAHGTGLIHRDVKPSNILIDQKSNRAKIADFGLARVAGGQSRLTGEGCLAGTPTYMSPEQARANPDLDARTDVYSLGATLYEALTGETPFRCAPQLVLRQVIEETPRALRQLNDQVPRDLETICLKAMAKEPNRRYQTAAEFADDLRRWRRGEAVQARPVGSLERIWRWCRRQPLVAGLAAALFLVIVAGFAGTFSQWRRAEAERRRALRQRDEALEQRALAERNFRQAREAVDTYLTQVSDNEVLKAQNLEPLRRELLRTARDFYERFVQQAPDDQRLAAELGRAHKRLGLITSVLESWPQALEHFQKMRAVFDRLHAAYPDDALYQSELAESWFREAVCLRTGAATSPTPAEAAFRRAQGLQEALVQAHPEEPAYRSDLARTLRSLGNHCLFMMNNCDLAEQTLIAARDLCDGLPPGYARAPAVRLENAVALLSLAKVYAHSDRPEEHRIAAETASARFENLVHTHSGNPDYVSFLIDALSELGDAHRSLAKIDRAQTTWERALGVAGDLVGFHPANPYYRHLVADIAYSLASLAYHEQHRGDLARPLLQKALHIEEELTANFPGVSEYSFYLSNLHRDFRDWFGDTAPLEAWRGRLTMGISEQENAARLAPEKRDGARLASYYERRAYANASLAFYSELPDDWRKTLASGATADVCQVMKALLLGQQGDYTRAESLAAALASKDEGNGRAFYAAAQVCARLAKMARNDPSLALARKKEVNEHLSRRAVEWIQKAQTLKYLSAPSTRWLLADHRDLDSLRERADFRALLGTRNGASRTAK